MLGGGPNTAFIVVCAARLIGECPSIVHPYGVRGGWDATALDRAVRDRYERASIVDLLNYLVVTRKAEGDQG